MTTLVRIPTCLSARGDQSRTHAAATPRMIKPVVGELPSPPDRSTAIVSIVVAATKATDLLNRSVVSSSISLACALSLHREAAKRATSVGAAKANVAKAYHRGFSIPARMAYARTMAATERIARSWRGVDLRMGRIRARRPG